MARIIFVKAGFLPGKDLIKCCHSADLSALRSGSLSALFARSRVVWLVLLKRTHTSGKKGGTCACYAPKEPLCLLSWICLRNTEKKKTKRPLVRLKRKKENTP